jgi:hypothetical protein
MTCCDDPKYVCTTCGDSLRALRPVLDDYHRHFTLDGSQDCGACSAILTRLPTIPRSHYWTTDEKHDYEWCRICLLVRQSNGSTDTKPCKGPAKVELRGTPEATRFAEEWENIKRTKRSSLCDVGEIIYVVDTLLNPSKS